MDIIIDTSVKDPIAVMKGRKKVGITASEKVFTNVGMPILETFGLREYKPTGIVEQNLLRMCDSKMGIDHTVIDKEDHPIHIQTRFRAPKYKTYDDFTIRYDIPDVDDYKGGAVRCEFFHLEAQAMFYGICNYNLTEDYGSGADKVTDLDKWVFCDLRIFMSLIKKGKIVITDDDEVNSVKTMVKDGVLYCGLGKNSGKGDSRFITINVKMANDFYPGLIIAQKGYF